MIYLFICRTKHCGLEGWLWQYERKEGSRSVDDQRRFDTIHNNKGGVEDLKILFIL